MQDKDVELRQNLRELERLGEIDFFDVTDYLDLEWSGKDVRNLKKQIRKLKIKAKFKGFVKCVKNF